jgi:glycine oxidase
VALNAISDRYDVVLVGGGVIGCGLARELAGRGSRVVLIERAEPGAEASGAAAGMLSPQADSTGRSPFFDLCLVSRELHGVWARELSEEAGIDVGYRRCGILRCSFEGGGRLADAFAWQRTAGLAIEKLDAPAAAARTGGRLSDGIREFLFFPEDGLVDGARLTHALAVSARKRGAEIHTGEAVRRCLLREGRCVGVETQSSVFQGDQVVLAAGAWSGFDASLPFSVPVEPVRGQIVELAADFELPTIVEDDHVYLVPRPGGRVLAGATLERVGFRKEVTAGAVAGLIASATRLVLGLSRAGFVRAWSGLRPGTPDGLPILGPSPIPGLFLATGHFRNGILLAPATARGMADLLSGAEVASFAPFSLSRFSVNSKADAPTVAPTSGVFG